MRGKPLNRAQEIFYRVVIGDRLFLTRDIHFGIMTKLPLDIANQPDHVNHKPVVAAGSLHSLVSCPPGVLVVAINDNDGLVWSWHYTLYLAIGRYERAR